MALDGLHSSLPEIIPRSHKNLSALPVFVRRFYSHHAMESYGGRPTQHPPEQFLPIDSHLPDLFGRGTSISVRSFVGQYLPIHDFQTGME